MDQPCQSFTVRACFRFDEDIRPTLGGPARVVEALRVGFVLGQQHQAISPGRGLEVVVSADRPPKRGHQGFRAEGLDDDGQHQSHVRIVDGAAHGGGGQHVQHRQPRDDRRHPGGEQQAIQGRFPHGFRRQVPFRTRNHRVEGSRPEQVQGLFSATGLLGHESGPLETESHAVANAGFLINHQYAERTRHGCCRPFCHHPEALGTIVPESLAFRKFLPDVSIGVWDQDESEFPHAWDLHAFG